ncbi:MAG: DUF4040 domain-containing protein [Chromatiaceae bacterium]|nr:MAG: DUF4040 domain-containing protein [Chromatiaceae bacterium]
MTPTLFADLGLLIILLGLALLITAARPAFIAVAAYMAYGLVMALAWVRLAAVDVALTEAAIGSGLTGLLLLGAVAWSQRHTQFQARRLGLRPGIPRRAGAGRGLTLLVALACGGVSAGLAWVVLTLPEPAPSQVPLVQAALPITGLGNPVTGVLLVFRAIDTLLESVVLVFALVGVWSLASDPAWGGRPRSLHVVQHSGALVLLGQLLPPVGILMGLYLFWVGADAPGGAFQGGTMLAAMWLLVLSAGLAEVPAVASRRLRLLITGGPLLFLAVGFSGWAFAAGFLGYPPAWSKPLILAIEAALTLSIAAALAMLVAGPPERPTAADPQPDPQPERNQQRGHR